MFSMHPDKSSGPDGMNPAFFQRFWHVIGKDVCEACLDVLSNSKIPEGMNDTQLVLIPKKQVQSLGDLRSISLCNVIYKIVAKAMENRLKQLLPKMISCSQGAFIPGRSITDNIFISFEVLHYLNRKTQGKHGFAALKVDMSKAYDRVEWDFLKRIMLRMGFHERWVNLIMECISTVQFKILHEGKELGPIIPQRGLRQGDPLSPYIFIICAEALSSLIQAKEKEEQIHGCQVARGAPTISHLFFADDCFIYFRANEHETRVVKQILGEYGIASGQRVNFTKSSISFSCNVDVGKKELICSLLGVGGTSDHGLYLGTPSFVGRSKKKVFEYIKDRV